MRWLILGAGGVGAYYAARLAHAGEQVTVVARGAHLEAIKRDGLKLHWEKGRIDATLDALDIDDLQSTRKPEHFDVLILVVKSDDTRQVLSQLSSWLSGSTLPLMSLQNGVDNEIEIADVVGEARTLGGLAIKLGAHIVEPGVVRGEGEARIVYGLWPQSAQQRPSLGALLDDMQAAFDRAAINANLSANIRRELWRKLIINNGVNPLSALTGLDTHSLTHHSDLRRIVIGMMKDVVVASRQEGVDLNDSDLNEMLDLITNFNSIKTSMLVDAEKNRPLEINAICGAVVHRCHEQGHDPVHTETIMTLLQHKVRC